MLFSFVSQVLLLLGRITWSSFSTCKSCHCTAEGLTFSDPIPKKSARNLNLYDFCHSPKKLAAVSPFRPEQVPCSLFRVHVNNSQLIIYQRRGQKVTVVWTKKKLIVQNGTFWNKITNFGHDWLVTLMITILTNHGYSVVVSS
jgi:hypothetical protein